MSISHYQAGSAECTSALKPETPGLVSDKTERLIQFVYCPSTSPRTYTSRFLLPAFVTAEINISAQKTDIPPKTQRKRMKTER